MCIAKADKKMVISRIFRKLGFCCLLSMSSFIVMRAPALNVKSGWGRKDLSKKEPVNQA